MVQQATMAKTKLETGRLRPHCPAVETAGWNGRKPAFAD
jgi:hypothetical protein